MGKGAPLLEGLAPSGRACPVWKGMPFLEGHAQHCLIGEKGGAPFGRARTFWKGAPLLEGRAPFGRACPFWKGMLNFACLIGKGAPLLVNARPKEIGIVGNFLTY